MPQNYPPDSNNVFVVGIGALYIGSIFVYEFFVQLVWVYDGGQPHAMMLPWLSHTGADISCVVAFICTMVPNG